MEKETSAIIFFGVFFLLCVLGYKLMSRSKRRYSKPRVQRGGYWSDERRHFDSQTKRTVLSAQKQRCNFCKCELAGQGITEFDHIDGDKTNNHFTNCQALCANCHRRKSNEENSFRNLP